MFYTMCSVMYTFQILSELLTFSPSLSYFSFSFWVGDEWVNCSCLWDLSSWLGIELGLPMEVKVLS